MKKVTALARRFVAGLTAEEALPSVKALNDLGIRTTLTVLGENVTAREEATRAVEEVLRLLDLVRDRGVDSNVSIKLTQMGLDIGEDFCLENAMRVVEKAAETENFIRLDMEGPKYTAATLDVFRRIFAERKNVGVVIQAMLHRSEADVADLLALGARMRLCKGAYKVPPSLAHRSKKDIARAYTGLLENLLASGLYHGVATHDEALIRWTLDHVDAKSIDARSFEFQMLYGMRRKRQIDLARQGFNVRCYVPYGTHWFPYFSRRLRERKENIFFVLRNLFTDS